ncbi:hypothetical protein [Actinoalloteichus hymeniacidonis]|uniref:hypothetical protein n=1 Tax=Actinoalloteichus hymeniacidonis TaxID=340345 RepID=UPI0012FB0853|nr:hypothetical protein [Actinoalloteichus hymeniacidonis]MBB5906938.1 hypothetical protein [Actinoalloteichus hymeniacidonis]
MTAFLSCGTGDSTGGDFSVADLSSGGITRLLTALEGLADQPGARRDRARRAWHRQSAPQAGNRAWVGCLHSHSASRPVFRAAVTGIDELNLAGKR